MDILVGLTAGLYVALNLLIAGGGKPNSASTVQVVNTLLCAIWFFSASFRGSILNTIGPAITACLGVLEYIIYVGSLFYFDKDWKRVFPNFCRYSYWGKAIEAISRKSTDEIQLSAWKINFQLLWTDPPFFRSPTYNFQVPKSKSPMFSNLL